MKNDTEQNAMTHQELDLTKSVLARIDSEGTTPRSRYYFTCKNTAFWGLFLITVIVGAVAVAAAFFSVSNSGYKYYLTTYGSFSSFVLGALPLLWIVLILLSIYLAHVNVRHTKCGYRYSLVSLTLFSLSGSVIAGSLMYLYGIGELVDERVSLMSGLHQSVKERQVALWHQPEEGRIIGRVIQFSSDANSARVVTPEDTEIELITAELGDRSMELLVSGKTVRILGLPTTSTETFYGCVVLSNEMRGRFKRDIEEEHSSEGVFDLSHIPERKPVDERSSRCRGVRSYEQLRNK